MRRIESTDGAATIWLFGSGTIGHEITKALSPYTSHVGSLDVPWSAPEEIRRAMESAEWPQSRGTNHVVWAAGKAGFSDDDETTRQEWRAFEEIVGFTRRLADQSDDAVRFHLISSAGGLYEGQSVASTDASPRPLRPYGRLKLAQETLATSSPQLITTVYRPSSVFTAPRPGNRPGLIGVLAAAAWHKRPARITGDPTTLRDYIAARDVGLHVARTIIERRVANRSPEFLIAGMATPIHIVVSKVEEITRRRMMVEYSNAWNALDITFSAHVKAPMFSSDPLSVGIHRVVESVRSS